MVRRDVLVVAMLVALSSLLLSGLLITSTATAQDQPDRFTIAVVPDTQSYVQTESGTAVFDEQFQWIAAERQARNIVFVSHVGDVSQDPSSTTEWDRIETIFATLDEAELPYGISPGNHDINPDGTAPEYDARFGASRYQGQPWFGGSHVAEGNRSSYQTVSVDGHELLFVHVRHLVPAYGDVDAVLDWVQDVLDDHPDHLTFVTTHEFTQTNGSIGFPALQDVIADRCTVAAVFSGHRFGYANGTFTDRCGRTVHHVLTNYQHLDGGGQGYLRTIEIDRLTLEADFQVYSPTLDQFGQGDGESFSTSLSPLVPVLGDANCDRSTDIGDALMVAQYSVGIRTAKTSCPLGQPSSDINISSADVNQDGAVNIGDALLIARCSVGIPNMACPD